MSEMDLSARARALTKNLENLKRHHSTMAKNSANTNGKLAIGTKRDSNSGGMGGWESGKLEKLENKIKELEKLEDKIKMLEKVENTSASGSAFEQQLLLMESKLKEMERALATKDEQLKNFEDKSSKFGQMDDLLKKLEKVEQIDKIYQRLEIIEQRGFGGGGGGSGKSGDELKKDIEEVQKIIMDEKASEKEKAEANIRMEKLMEEYEKTPEFRAEIEKQKEEKLKRNEPLNKAALEKMKRIYTPASIVNDPDLYNRVQKYPELKLIALEPNIIIKMHESDYRTYSLAMALTVDELRAIRANMPKFRRDQKVQVSFVETLDNKIEEKSNKSDIPAAPKKAAAKKFKLPKAPPAGSPDTGGLFAELLRKRGAIAAAAGDDDGSAPSSAPAPAPAPAPIVYQPPPPPPANCPPPPPLPALDRFAPPPPPPPSFGGLSSAPPPPPPPSFSGLAPPPPPPSLAGITAPPTSASQPAMTRPHSTAAPPKPMVKPAAPTSSPDVNKTPNPSSRPGSTLYTSAALAPSSLTRSATAPVESGSPSPGVRKLKPPTEMPPKEQIAQLKLVKDSLQALLNGLKNKDDARQIAAHTKTVVANIMNLAAMGKSKYPSESSQLETRCTELVQTVKEVLSSKAGLDKFEASVGNLTQNAAMTLGYTLA